MEKLKPEQVVAMLRKKGMEVNIEQATLILGFMRKLSEMVVSNYLATHRDSTERCKLEKRV